MERGVTSRVREIEVPRVREIFREVGVFFILLEASTGPPKPHGVVDLCLPHRVHRLSTRFGHGVLWTW